MSKGLIKLCKEEKCERKVLARGLCQPHYLRNRKENDIKPLPKYECCKVSGCYGSHKAKGYCQKHYNKMRYKSGARNYGKTGIAKDEIYSVWEGMKARCYRKNHNSYQYYGAKGIAVCKEWVDDFRRFRDDMGSRPKGFTLERLNNELGYSKDNCVWASMVTQNRNKAVVKLSMDIARKIRISNSNGVPVKILSKKYGVSEASICDVVKNRTWKEDAVL